MNINESITLYLKDKDVYCSKKSCEYYKNMLHLFEMFLNQQEIIDTDNLSQDVLKQYVLFLRKRGIKNTSIHTYMRGLKNYCNWGMCNGSLPAFDYHIKLPRQDPAQILPLSSDEVDSILNYIRENCLDPDNKELFFRLLLDCGLRSSEALKLCRSDVDTDKGIIKINKSKYDKSRMIPLPGSVRSLLPDKDGKLFSFGQSGKHSFFKRIRAATGIDRLHAHLLRHTFATSYMVNVGNLEFLRMYMGHSTYDVTKGYISAAYQCNLLKYDIYKIDDIFS